MASDPSTDSGSGPQRWLRLAAEFAALFGAIFYAVLREEYRVYYNDLKITPDDVGLSPLVIVAGSAFGTLLIGLVVAALIGAYVAFRKPHSGRREVGRAQVIFLVLVSCVALHVAIRSRAHQAGDCVKAGSTIRYVTLLGVPLMNVRAQAAAIEWLDNAPERPRLGSRLRFLGQNDGTVVLFDVDSQAPLRLPAGEVLVRIRSVKEGCIR
jgi:hypothetical protein